MIWLLVLQLSLGTVVGFAVARLVRRLKK